MTEKELPKLEMMGTRQFTVWLTAQQRCRSP